MAADLIVLFDTASDNVALALARASDGELLAERNFVARREANVRLVPTIDELLASIGSGGVGNGKRDIAAVVCGRGPGSFTGVRIAVATAKGLAMGAGCKLYGFSTLDALAWTAWLAGTRGNVGVVADAMRHEVYPARYALTDAGVQRLDPHTVAKAADVAAAWSREQSGQSPQPLQLTGDGLAKYAEQFLDAPGNFTLLFRELWCPSGAGLLAAFKAACAAGTEGSGDPADLLPIYTRLSDAEENERTRLHAGGAIAQGALVDVPLTGVNDAAAGPRVVYRPLALGDIPAVVALEGELFGAGAWTAGKLEPELHGRERIWWVAAAENELVGYAGAWVVAGQLEVMRIGVAPAHRRRGVASELLARLVADGAALAATEIILEVRTSNALARAFYSALGLKEVGERPDYYPPVSPTAAREPAILMAGSLPLATLQRPRPDAKPNPAGDRGRSFLQPEVSSAAPRILAIETSCDETAAAVIDGDGTLLANVVASQIAAHARFGGVVPEIASRKHTESICAVVEDALAMSTANADCHREDSAGSSGVPSGQQGLTAKHATLPAIDAVAVTYAPGLVGALVVGVAFAKGLAWAADLPLIIVNHLEGHIYANRLSSGSPIAPPFVIALLSGGHTMLVHVRAWGSYEVLGQTLDDAVGEAFDKVAKALGLGYPGGPIISKLAQSGNPKAIDFPRALLHSHDLQFSLSGLKTAVITYIRDQVNKGVELNLPDIAAAFQAAVIDVQVAKARDALAQTGAKTFAIGGGVAANRALRQAYVQALEPLGIQVVIPPDLACTDNAAMIARVALDRYKAGKFAPLDADAHARTNLAENY